PKRQNQRRRHPPLALDFRPQLRSDRHSFASPLWGGQRNGARSAKLSGWGYKRRRGYPHPLELAALRGGSFSLASPQGGGSHLRRPRHSPKSYAEYPPRDLAKVGAWPRSTNSLTPPKKIARSAGW